MKNLLKYSVYGLLSVGLLGSCNDSKFLEEDPETFYTIDNVFSIISITFCATVRFW